MKRKKIQWHKQQQQQRGRKKRSRHVGHFIILLDQSSGSRENTPRHTDADAINPAAAQFDTDDQENCTLGKHCGVWMCYMKARRYDKALTDQIKGDLQLLPSRLGPAGCSQIETYRDR